MSLMILLGGKVYDLFINPPIGMRMGQQSCEKANKQLTAQKKKGKIANKAMRESTVDSRIQRSGGWCEPRMRSPVCRS